MEIFEGAFVVRGSIVSYYKGAHIQTKMLMLSYNNK